MPDFNNILSSGQEIKYVNTGNDDIVVKLAVKGTQSELEAMQKQLAEKFAAMGDFEVEKCYVEVSKDPQEETANQNDSQNSTLSDQMRNEIEDLIEAKFK